MLASRSVAPLGALSSGSPSFFVVQSSGTVSFEVPTGGQPTFVGSLDVLSAGVGSQGLSPYCDTCAWLTNHPVARGRTNSLRM